MKNYFLQRKFIQVFIFCALNFIFITAKAQVVFHLSVKATDKDSTFFEKNFRYEKIFDDTFFRTREIKNLFTKLYNNSYLFAHEDSAKTDSNTESIFISAGKICEWSKLSNGNVPLELLDKIGFREKIYEGKKFSSQEISSLCESILNYSENNGYPFASVQLDSFKIDEEKISAKIFYTPGKLITIDSIDINGNAKISKTFLANYIGIKQNSFYNEDAIRKISSRLLELPYLRE